MPDAAALRWRLAQARRWVAVRLARRAIHAVARIRALRRLPRWVVIPVERLLIRLDGARLFDADFYLRQNGDVTAAGVEPLAHYLRHGWREGRAPNRYFDDAHYRGEAGIVRGAPVSALGHFLAVGRELGLCPVPGVDLMAYQTSHPGLRVASIDAYAHLVGQQETPPSGRPDLGLVLAALPTLRPPHGQPVVDVVVPVYRGRAETLNTLVHVLRARSWTPFALVVIDDCTPEPELARDLDALAARGLIRLIRHAQNHGFVVSTNAGSSLDADRDVVWLNADTEVYDGWLDRLRAAALSAPQVATVTPLTNNGTICSYPRPNVDNPGEVELAWPAIDALAAEANHGLRVTTPTAVGFCTYVRRVALDDVGPLDAETFGRGYGEENDFSQRAVARGWSNLIAADVVVRHFGATSFQGLKALRIEAALKVLDRRYPGYNAEVGRWIDRDPLAPARRNLDLARLQRLRRDRNVLIVTHSRGGGTQQHVQEEVDRLTRDGASVYLLTGGALGRGTACLGHASAGQMPGLAALDWKTGALWQVLAALSLDEVQVHHLIDFDGGAPAVFRRQLRELGVPYSFTVHDYFAVCPRVTMTDRMGRYCGEPGPAGCQRCVTQRGSEAGAVAIAEWRGDYRAFLQGAEDVRVPDSDVAERLARYVPGLDSLRVVPHESPDALRPRSPVPPRRPGPLRLAVIGAIGPAKGFDVVLGVARHLQAIGSDARLTVIGHTRDDAAARAAGVEVTGAYVNADVDRLVADADPDLIWIPSIWPETYCYTLSIALRSGRPVAAFAIGALATRLAGVRRACLLPLEVSAEPETVWAHLEGACRRADHAVSRARAVPDRS